MNRAELHNIPGFHTASLLAAEIHLRTEFKPERVSSEPTALIRNEGWMQGYLQALADLRAAAQPRPEPTGKTTYQPYSAAQSGNIENQNRK